MSRVVKAIVFTAQANVHDTSVKVRNVMKWLKAGHDVRVSIAGKLDRRKSMEAIVSQLHDNIKTGAKFVQQTSKSDKIALMLTPTEDAVNLKTDSDTITLKQKTETQDILITPDKDVFSKEFEMELDRSIQAERNKNKKN